MRRPTEQEIARRQQAARDAKIVNGTPEGERLIGYLLDFCHVLRDSMPPDGNDNVWKLNEGQRSVGNEIAALLILESTYRKVDTLRQLSAQAEGVDF